MNVINYSNIENNIDDLRSKFLNAKPFPHIQFLDFLNQDFFKKFNEEIPVTSDDIKKNNGKKFSTMVEKKKWISTNTELPQLTKILIDELNSEKFLKILNLITTLKSLVTTNLGNTELSNYHEMEPGGYLGPHVDHGAEPKTGLPHVLNIVVYLTQNWVKSWRGGTSLYNQDGKKLIAEIDYIPNSAIVFLHTPYSFHGVEKISEDANLIRRSIYVDYYSENLDPYKNFNLNFNKNWFNHGTKFVIPNFSEYFKKKNFLYLKINLNYILSKFFNK